MKTVKETILKMNKNGGNTKLVMDLLNQLSDQEQKATDSVYEFFRKQLKDDQDMMSFARNQYDSYLKNDTDCSSFENWFKGCVYDMSGDCWRAGVEYWLGQLKYNDKLDHYLEEVKFNDFLKDMDYHCQVKFNYSVGSYPGDIDSMLIDPNVHIDVEFIERPMSYGK